MLKYSLVLGKLSLSILLDVQSKIRHTVHTVMWTGQLKHLTGAIPK